MLQHNFGPVHFLIRLAVDLSKLPASVSLVGNARVCLFLILDVIRNSLKMCIACSNDRNYKTRFLQLNIVLTVHCNLFGFKITVADKNEIYCKEGLLIIESTYGNCLKTND